MPDAPRSRFLSWRLLAVSTVLALLAAIGTVALLSDDDDDPIDPGQDDVGLVPAEDPDPDGVRFTTFDGEVVALSSLEGTPVVVNFFSSDCVPCITEMPAFEEVHQQLGDQVTFLGLAVADRPEDALELVDTTGVTYRTAQDKDASAITALGGLTLPTTVVLDEDGEIVADHGGDLTADELRALLAEALDIAP